AGLTRRTNQRRCHPPWCAGRQQLGDRSWGRVPGSSRRLGVAQGTRRSKSQTRIDLEKTRRGARLFRRVNGCFSLHGEECHEEGPPGDRLRLVVWSYRRGGPFRCCTPVWISVASVSTSTCSTPRVRPSRWVRHRLTRMDFAA